ncbi:MAG: TetR/AcrR family transcriptional regulator [Desulfovibrionales bacterium]
MPYAKVIPISRPQTTRDKLLKAVGTVLAREGFRSIGVNKVAREAGVNKSLIYRYYGGLKELLSAYGRSLEFWPSAEELLEGRMEEFQNMPPKEQIALFFKQYMASLRKRPQTLEILAWEMLERNELTSQLEYRRVRTALEFFELLHGEIPESIDLTALVVILASAVNYLVVRSRVSGHFGGIDFTNDKGWDRIESAFDLLMRGALDVDGREKGQEGEGRSSKFEGGR